MLVACPCSGNTAILLLQMCSDTEESRWMESQGGKRNLSNSIMFGSLTDNTPYG